MFDLSAVQAAIQSRGFDGWLLCDFRGSNVLAQRIAGVEGKKLSRRWYYYIPANDKPRKLVHAIEPAALDHLPGNKAVYRRWQELERDLGLLIAGGRTIAMEYSPRNGNPYISRVDAGTIELIRSFGVEVASSGDLIQLFEAAWDDDQIAMHFEAARHTDAAFRIAWDFVRQQVKAAGHVMERAVQQRILDHFTEQGMTTYSPPIVAVNAHSGDPHFENTPQNDTPIKPGDFLLIDLWAKMDRPRSVYSDLTRVAVLGEPTPRQREVFDVVAAARDAGIKAVQDAFAANRPLLGHEVDDATRAVIDAAGFGEFFTHRTGHNIGQEVHGNGAHMDGLETREDRRVLPRTCFSIEPGIYLPEFGVRLEVNVLVDHEARVHVTGGDLQREIQRLD